MHHFGKICQRESKGELLADFRLASKNNKNTTEIPRANVVPLQVLAHAPSSGLLSHSVILQNQVKLRLRAPLKEMWQLLAKGTCWLVRE